MAVLSVLTLSVSSATETEDAAGRIFRAGAAAVDITPTTLPLRIAGGIVEIWADRVEDPLHARALVLDDGRTVIALCLVDSCLIPRDLLDNAKIRAQRATGIPPERMLIAATHTHSAPAVMGVHGTDPHPEYREFVTGKIAEAIQQAYAGRRPAQVGWGADACMEFVHCRRWIMKPGTAFTVPFTGREENQAQMNPGHENPNLARQTGPVDPAVTVLSVRTPEGKPLALLANYSTHYAGAPNISADYFGVFARRIGELIGADNAAVPFMGIMSNGTSGDANCIDFSKPPRDFDRFTVAEAVAQAALRAYRKIEHHAWVPLSMEETRLVLGVRKAPEQEVKLAKEYLEKNVKDRPVRNWEENYARETVLVDQMPDRVEIILQSIGIGDLGIAAIPCETFGATGLKLKKDSPFPLTMNISIANGAHGYLPPPDQFPLGGYTTWRARTSYLETEAEPKIVQTLLGLLKKARKDET
ncbi:MAG: hypothetical protein ACE15F_10440 [bacterium]